jgi:hypothetical protein
MGGYAHLLDLVGGGEICLLGDQQGNLVSVEIKIGDRTVDCLLVFSTRKKAEQALRNLQLDRGIRSCATPAEAATSLRHIARETHPEMVLNFRSAPPGVIHLYWVVKTEEFAKALEVAFAKKMSWGGLLAKLRRTTLS